MATNKSFTHAGVSKLDGAFKVRFANDALRVKVLAKNGHSDIDMVELPSPMQKEDAIAYLIASAFYTEASAEVKAALEAAVDARAVTPPRAPKAAKAAPAKKAAVKAPAKAAPVKKAPAKKAVAKKATVTPAADAEVPATTPETADAPY